MRTLCTALCVVSLSAFGSLSVAACSSSSDPGGFGGGQPSSETIGAGGIDPGVDPDTGRPVEAATGPTDPGNQGMAIVPGAVKGGSTRYKMESVVAPMGAAEAATLGDGEKTILPGIVGATSPGSATPPTTE